MIALTKVRGSQVSMGAEGGSNGMHCEHCLNKPDALSRTSVTLLTRIVRAVGVLRRERLSRKFRESCGVDA